MHREVIKRILIEEKNIGLFVDFISKPREFVVDHIDGDPLNNTRNNLRVVTPRQNMQNKHVKKTSKYPGVLWIKSRHKWRTEIKTKGKSIHLGYFSDEREAAKAYEKACRRMFGEELVCKIKKNKRANSNN